MNWNMWGNVYGAAMRQMTEVVLLKLVAVIIAGIGVTADSGQMILQTS